MAITKQILEVNSFSGMNQSVPHNLIEDNQCIFMGNMSIKDGLLKKRNGYKLLHSDEEEEDLSDLFIYKDTFFIIREDLSNNIVVKQKTAKSPFEAVPIEPLAKFTDNQYFVKFNDSLYLFTDLALYKLTDGRFKKETLYLPTVLTTCSPEGDGQYLEDINLLSNKFKVEYSIPNTIPDSVLLPTSISIKGKNGLAHFPLLEGVSCNGDKLIFLTDYTTGRASAQEPVKIAFTASGKKKITKGTNNFVCTCYFELTDNTTDEFNNRFRKISKCKVYTNYGGDNDTRILASGNSDIKNSVFRSGVLDITYFPENAYQLVGDNSESITAFEKQYDCCLVFKEKSIWRIEFNITADGKVTYPVKPLNDNVGCSYLGCSENIDGNSVFLNNQLGLCRVYQSNERGETNVGGISKAVNSIKINGYDFEMMVDLPELARYSGLLPSIRYPDIKPSLIDDGERLYISCQRSIFVYDYKLKAWYVWNMQNMYIHKLFMYHNDLGFISGNKIFILKNESSYPLTNHNNAIKLYCDTEEELPEAQFIEKPIYSIWISKQYDFGINERKKTVDRLFIEMQSLPRNSVEVYVLTKDNKTVLVSEKINDLFGYNRLAYNRYTYNITPFPREMTIKYKAKKIGHFQFILTNGMESCASNVQAFDIRFKTNNYFK